MSFTFILQNKLNNVNKSRELLIKNLFTSSLLCSWYCVVVFLLRSGSRQTKKSIYMTSREIIQITIITTTYIHKNFFYEFLKNWNARTIILFYLDCSCVSTFILALTPWTEFFFLAFDVITYTREHNIGTITLIGRYIFNV